MPEPSRPPRPSLHGTVAAAALALIGWGCHDIYPPAAPLVVGTLLLAFTVAGSLRR